jgi:molecular chaperone DnaK (HSP70)
MATGDIYYGIDIGTGNCSMAWVVDSPRLRQRPLIPVEMIQFEDSARERQHPRFPSVAIISSESPTKRRACFGWAALRDKQAGHHPGQDLFYSVKSEMGTRTVYDDTLLPAELGTPVQITAALLTEMVNTVLKSGRQDPRKTRTVVTVPASFAANQRQDTLEAARLAGLNVGEGDLLDEPVAALLDLLNSPELDARILPTEPTNLMVFDFGAGTCDVAILRVQYDEADDGPLGLRVETLGIGPYERFGGDNFDWAVMERVVWPQVCERHSLNEEDLPAELKSRFLRANAWRVGREMKENLCNRLNDGGQRSGLRVTARTEKVELDGHVIAPTNVSLTTEDFELAIAPFIAASSQWALFGEGMVECSLLRPIEETLEQAGLEPEEIHYLILNGGSCRNPYVRDCLEHWGHIAGAKVLAAPDLDTSVARGAALHCYWQHARGQTLVAPIANEELGVMTREQTCVPVIASGTPLPYPSENDLAIVDWEFGVPEGARRELAIPIYAGSGHRRRFVGTGRVELPKNTPPGTPVEIAVQVDANRITEWHFRVLSQPEIEGELIVSNPWVNRVTRPEERAVEAASERIAEAFERAGQVPLGLRVEQGAALYRAGEYLKAREVLEGVIRRDKGYAEPHNWLGLTWHCLGDHEKAYGCYCRAAELDSENSTYRANSGAALVDLGLAAEAVGILQEVVASHPDLQYCHTWLGHACRKLGDEERAQKEFRRSATLLARRISDMKQPRSRDYRDLAYLQRLVGDYDEADRCAKRAEELRHQDLIGADPEAVVASQDVLDLLGGPTR